MFRFMFKFQKPDSQEQLFSYSMKNKTHQLFMQIVITQKKTLNDGQ